MRRAYSSTTSALITATPAIPECRVEARTRPPFKCGVSPGARPRRGPKVRRLYLVPWSVIRLRFAWRDLKTGAKMPMLRRPVEESEPP
jgi:hypothetical protein